MSVYDPHSHNETSSHQNARKFIEFLPTIGPKWQYKIGKLIHILVAKELEYLDDQIPQKSSPSTIFFALPRLQHKMGVSCPI